MASARAVWRRAQGTVEGAGDEPRACSLAGQGRSGGGSRADYLPALQKDLIAVIGKYVHIASGDIKVSLEKWDNLEALEVKIELPDTVRPGA